MPGCFMLQFDRWTSVRRGVLLEKKKTFLTFVSSVRSSNGHPDLLVIQHHPILWHTLTYSCILWHTLATLAYSGILLHTLAYSCILWHNLAYSGILLQTLAYSGILWHTLAYSGILWHSLAYSGTISASLISADGAYHCPVGSIWPSLSTINGT